MPSISAAKYKELQALVIKLKEDLKQRERVIDEANKMLAAHTKRDEELQHALHTVIRLTHGGSLEQSSAITYQDGVQLAQRSWFADLPFPPDVAIEETLHAERLRLHEKVTELEVRLATITTVAVVATRQQ